MTKGMSRLLMGIWFLMAGAVLTARAEEEGRAPKPYIVLVGISDYADKSIKPRPHAEADAQALYDLFTKKEYLGVEPDRVRLLLGKEDAGRKSQPATHANILKALQWVVGEAKRDDLVVFAFIGQGVPLSEQGDRLGYLASDSTVKDRAKTTLAAAEIAQELDKLKSQRFCALLDVNFKNTTTGKEPLPEPTLETTLSRTEFLGNEGKEDHTPALGRVVFMASTGLVPSIDLEKQGLFTQVILDGLKGAADKDGYEPDGVVTVDELTEHLEKTLPDLARKHGKTKDEKEQIHVVLGGRASHFVLTQNPAVTAKVTERVGKIGKLANDKKISSELAEEGRTLLSRMPKLEAQRSLRKEYQSLADATIDVDKFLENRDKILDSAKLKRSVALEYAKKVIEVTQTIKELYVKDVNQGEMVAWAVRGLYRRIDEKIPQDITERLNNVKDLKEADLTVLLADVRERLGNREDLAKHKDIDFSLQRMLSHLDPYTTYIDPETLDKFKTDTTGMFTGIGIQIRKDTAKDMLQVVTPIMGSPAYKAGILEGDVITTVTREVDSYGKPLDPPEVISTKGLPINDAVTKIKGLPRTKVKLTIERPGEEKPREFEITRTRVELESVLGIRRKADDNWDYVIDHANKIAYVRLNGFARNTYRDLVKVMKDLEKEKVKGMILDLRFNPGGLLDSAVKISDLFIDDGLIVSIKPKAGRPSNFAGERDGSYLDFPMVCLVNGQSASGSEIVSACLQDHGRAVVMGERSYGKGSVQNIQPFEGGELKVTTASFWRPNGKNLNKSSTAGKDDEEWGVVPDKGFQVKLSRKEREELFENQRDQEIIHRQDWQIGERKPEFKDKQLETALEYLRGQISTAARPTSKKAG